MASGDVTLMVGSGVSASGIPFALTATTEGSAHTLHTVAAGGYWDAVTVEAVNLTSATVTLYLNWGGSGVSFPVPPNPSPVVVAGSWRVRDGVVLKAWASSAAALAVKVDIDRYEI